MLPRQPDQTSEALLAKLSIAKVMDFTSQTLRSGAVVWSDDGPRGSALLFLRGAPAVIRDMVQPSTVPQDFNQVSQWSSPHGLTQNALLSCAPFCMQSCHCCAVGL